MIFVIFVTLIMIMIMVIIDINIVIIIIIVIIISIIMIMIMIIRRACPADGGAAAPRGVALEGAAALFHIFCIVFYTMFAFDV